MHFDQNAARGTTKKYNGESAMQDTKQKILTLLKMNGGLTTSDLSDMLGISATAVRRHLNTLEAQDLITHRTEQQGMGRPGFIYELAVGASNVFPQSYATFATNILQDLVKMEGIEKLDELFNQRQESRRQQYVSQVDGENLSERIASLARLLESEGRMTTWQQLDKGRYILREHNCPILQVAEQFDHPCRCEVALFREILNAQVKRIGHIPEGDIACVYEIESLDDKHAQDQLVDGACIESDKVSLA
jgi:predicted ArsR family transcriptional regulator